MEELKDTRQDFWQRDTSNSKDKLLDTFSLVAKLTTVRLLLALAATKYCILH